LNTPKSYRAVIFDLDGTLVDSYQALTNAVNFVREARGLPVLPSEIIRASVGEGVEKLLARVMETDALAPEVQHQFEARYDEICCEQSSMLGEVTQVLDELHAAGIRMAVCTNKPTSFSEKILESLGAAKYFDSIAGPDRAGARKPDPRHLTYVLETTGCDKDAALFVGDMPIDITTARNCGVDVAVIATGSSPAEELRAAAPDYFLERFSDLRALVLR